MHLSSQNIICCVLVLSGIINQKWKHMEKKSALSHFIMCPCIGGRVCLSACRIMPRSCLFSVCASGNFLCLCISVNNVSSHLDETINIWEEKQALWEEKWVDGGVIIVRLSSFVFILLLSLLVLCVINMWASIADRWMRERWRDG